MKALQCEMCGSKDIVKQDGYFVCQYCGTKYSVEEAKKMMIEGTVDVSGSTVKIDNSDEVANLYKLARRAKNDESNEDALKYYDMILIKDPSSWEAYFYVAYFKTLECNSKIDDHYYIDTFKNCVITALQLIKNNIIDKETQKKAYCEVSEKTLEISEKIYNSAETNYLTASSSDTTKIFRSSLRMIDIYGLLYFFGDKLDEMFGTDSEANQYAAIAWKRGITYYLKHNDDLPDKTKQEIKGALIKRAENIRKYDPSYVLPQKSENNFLSSASGCYVATAVYGSYDCPEVWTLRRFRDYTLAESVFGRLFIRLYYAVSPTLVKWFGKTEWFKNLWKPTLDKMVAKLNSDGVEDTPYSYM